MPLRFSGLILDLDACLLRRESGEIVPLTRSEFSLLRFLAQRPGRAFSRETLLSTVSNRRFTPFDRSVDVLVTRLRRKIETDPKAPCVIVTVPGEGYRFDGLGLPSPPAVGDDASPNDWRSGSLTFVDGAPARSASIGWSRLTMAMTVLCLVLSLALVGLWRHWPEDGPPPTALPRVAVPPFANLTGDAGNDYLGRKFAFEVSAFLAAYPAVQVVASPDAASFDPREVARSAGAQYVVQGSVDRGGESLRVTATLYHGASRTAVWSQVFDCNSGVERAQDEDIPRRIYDSLAGFRGRIQAKEEEIAWSKASKALDEYDYFVRGMSLYSRSTVSDVLKARVIFQEGLDRYPHSVLLRLRLAWTHLWMAMDQANSDPRPDVERAWRLAETLSGQPQSPLEAWQAHWLMAFLHQWRDNDFSRSVAEARRAAELAPYDAYSRNDLSWILANAGYGDEAVAWARSGLEHDPNGPSRYHANLAWAYYIAGRHQDAVDALRERSGEFPVLHATLLVQLGQVEKAKSLIADYLKSGGADTVEREDIVPLVEPVGTAYVEVLRKAGLPQK